MVGRYLDMVETEVRFLCERPKESMDANKLKVLREIGYAIQKTCGNCLHATFPSNDWGTCGIWTYQHEKHTGDVRELSINKDGVCPHHEVDEASSVVLGAFREFLGQ